MSHSPRAESYPPSGALAHSLSRYNLPKRGLQSIERGPILLCCQSCGTRTSFLRSLLIDVAQSFISVPSEVMRPSCSARGLPGGWKVVVMEFVMHGIDLNKCPQRCANRQVQGKKRAHERPMSHVDASSNVVTWWSRSNMTSYHTSVH